MGSEPTSPRKSRATGLLNGAKPRSAPQRRERPRSTGRKRSPVPRGWRWRSDRHHLGHGDPVEAVHEVDEIHEPDAAEDEKRLLHAVRNPFGKSGRRRHDDGGDGGRLQEKAQAAEGADVVDSADDARSDCGGAGKNGERRIRPPATKNECGSATAISAAPTTAMPPPCGVGILWLDRALGRASA